MNFVVSTSTGRHLPFELLVDEIKYSDVVVDKSVTEKLCESCRMYGHRGGCPPVSPNFDRVYRDKTKHIYLTTLKVPCQQWGSRKVMADPNSNRRFLMMSSFVEIMVKGVEKKLINILRSYGGKVLPSSYCTACPTCVAVDGNPCVKPKERMFSMEATGILVHDTCVKAGMSPLEWYERDKQVFPHRIRKIMAYMADQPLDISAMFDEFSQAKAITRVQRKAHENH